MHGPSLRAETLGLRQREYVDGFLVSENRKELTDMTDGRCDAEVAKFGANGRDCRCP
jgi:hypothetical protein